MSESSPQPPVLQFRGGLSGALTPFFFFLAVVAWLGISGAPDERGFWPVLLAALALGLLLARDREAYCEAAIDGMSKPIVALMILAWLLAGVFGKLMSAGGFVDALIAAAQAAGVRGGGFAIASFLICCVVSTATGTSLGTLIICTPLLYPASAGLAADPLWTMAAILGGATFGDNISPVSDTTIASAGTQGAAIGDVVRSRMRYALPAAAVAAIVYGAFGGAESTSVDAVLAEGSWRGLPLLLAPLVALALLLLRRHLIEGLLAGIAAAIVLGLGFGLLAWEQIFYIDAERFSARGLIVDGMERSLGVSVFTLLLMGLVGTLNAAGLTSRLLEAAQNRAHGPRTAEAWMVAVVSAAVLLTTHSVVAILAVGPFTRATGERFGIGPERRANLLDVTVCTWPFLVPYCIPTILAASLTSSGADVGLPKISAAAIGLANAHSWALLAMVVFAVATGWGRTQAST